MQHTTENHPYYRLLTQYLYSVRHSDLGLLSESKTIQILEDAYQQYFLFMSDSVPFADWYKLFKDYCYDTVEMLQIHELRPYSVDARWLVDELLNSIEFNQFRQQSIKMPHFSQN